MLLIDCVMYSMLVYDSSLLLLQFRVSRNFPETAWRAFKATRRLMLFSVYFWVLARNCLVARSCR